MNLMEDRNIMELFELLHRNGMKEAADSLFSMAMYVDAMEEKMDSVLEELRAVKRQLGRMEEQELEKRLRQPLQKTADKLEQDCRAIKEILSEVKEAARAKAGEIAAAAKQKGKAALNKVSEFLGIREKLRNIRRDVRASIADVDRCVKKIDAFGTGMREAGQKIANTLRIFAGKPEKEYGEKKFSKTELLKKPFQAKRKLLVGVMNCADAAIEKTEQLAADVKRYQADKAGRDEESIGNPEDISPVEFAGMGEPEFLYGAEAFEVYRKGTAKVEIVDKAAKNVPVKSGKSR